MFMEAVLLALVVALPLAFLAYLFGKGKKVTLEEEAADLLADAEKDGSKFVPFTRAELEKIEEKLYSIAGVTKTDTTSLVTKLKSDGTVAIVEVKKLENEAVTEAKKVVADIQTDAAKVETDVKAVGTEFKNSL